MHDSLTRQIDYSDPELEIWEDFLIPESVIQSHGISDPPLSRLMFAEWEGRKQALLERECHDSILEDFALNDPEVQIQLIAVSRLKIRSVLEAIANSTADIQIRTAATQRLEALDSGKTFEEFLDSLRQRRQALGPVSPPSRNTREATEMVDDPQVLLPHLRDRRIHSNDRLRLLDHINDEDTLEELACDKSLSTPVDLDWKEDVNRHGGRERPSEVIRTQACLKLRTPETAIDILGAADEQSEFGFFIGALGGFARMSPPDREITEGAEEGARLTYYNQEIVRAVAERQTSKKLKGFAISFVNDMRFLLSFIANESDNWLVATAKSRYQYLLIRSENLKRMKAESDSA